MSLITSSKRDIQKLQRSIVNGLEDVKAHDIRVFNTEHLSPLFERVMVASGTSNRQTRALASSVVDAVRDAGYPKPRIEGEENGEWIIVDCGQAVVHIMQPAIRDYYHLEEIWGDKPVRLKRGGTPVAAKPAGTPTPRAKAAASPANAPPTPPKRKSAESPAKKTAGATRPARGSTASAPTSRAKSGKPPAKAGTAARAPTVGKRPRRP